MHFLPISVAIFIIFFLVPFLIFMLPAVAFAKLGLSPFAGLAFFWFSLIGSLINIPVYRKELEYYEEPDEIAAMFNRFFGIRVPVFHQEQVIALNLGGAVLPGLLSLYLLFRINLVPAIISTAIVTAFSYYLSKPVKGVGSLSPRSFLPLLPQSQR